jgi:cystathionine beta-lyase/cystathionine gamma-synthase
MNWNRIAGAWKQLKGLASRERDRQANKKQLAEWLARQHKVDPIHK